MIKKIILLVLAVNLSIVIVRLFYNYSKFITDKNSFLYKSSTEVEQFYFAESKTITDLLHAKNYTNIYLVNIEPQTYYYLRYRLFPVKVYRNNEVISGKDKRPLKYDAYIFTDAKEMRDFLEQNKDYYLLQTVLESHFVVEKYEY